MKKLFFLSKSATKCIFLVSLHSEDHSHSHACIQAIHSMDSMIRACNSHRDFIINVGREFSSFVKLSHFIIAEPHAYMPNAWLSNELKLKCWHHSSVEFSRPRTMFSLNIILRNLFFPIPSLPPSSPASAPTTLIIIIKCNRVLQVERQFLLFQLFTFILISSLINTRNEQKLLFFSCGEQFRESSFSLKTFKCNSRKLVRSLFLCCDQNSKVQNHPLPTNEEKAFSKRFLLHLKRLIIDFLQLTLTHRWMCAVCVILTDIRYTYPTNFEFEMRNWTLSLPFNSCVKVLNSTAFQFSGFWTFKKGAENSNGC